MTSPHEKKRKIKSTVVVTANRLGDGAVVYRTALGGWTTDLDRAAVAATPAAANELLAQAEADGVHAVGAYLAPVEVTLERRVLPANLRERIRKSGPTFELPGATR